MKRRWLGILAAIPLGIALSVPAHAHASTIVPYPSALDYGRTLAINDTGAQLANAWVNNASNDPGNCVNPRTAGITVSGSSVTLTSNGNDCVYLQSPHMYPTVHGYVYEEKITVSNWTQWLSFWGYGNNWPSDGEIDSIEASPTGQNNISWHDSTSNPTGYSTCNNQDGCDGNALPITSPSNAEQLAHSLSPGTHIIDIAFGGTGVFTVWYDGIQAAWVQTNTGDVGGANDNPFWLDNSTGKPEFGSCGNPCGSITVDYWRAWTGS